MNETYVTIRGRLVADPTVRTTRTGAPMTTFRIASSVRRPVQGQQGVWEDAGTSFYGVTTYKALAANAAVSLRKGHPVTIHGKQQITSWVKDDGTTWWAVEVVADAVGHDLTYGTTAFAKVGRPADGDGFRTSGAEFGGGPGFGGGPEFGGGPGFGDGPEPGGFPGPEFGAPDDDPYVVEGGPERGLGQVGSADTGPLVPAGEEAAA